MTRVLLVDDDPDLLDVMDFALRRDGFEVSTTRHLKGARRLLVQEPPDLVLLDVNLEGGECGLDLLREIRTTSSLPVILVTGRESQRDKIQGLDLGADDYITKPFDHEELAARIRAVLRGRGYLLATISRHGIVRQGPFVVNLAEHSVTRDGVPVSLTVTEFRLLTYFMAHPGVVIPNREVLQRVWRDDDPRSNDVVRITLHRLRLKLEPDPTRPRYLLTIPGVGILFKPEPDREPAGRTDL